MLATASFPAISLTVIDSLVLSSNTFIKDFPSEDFVHPLTFCTSSFEIIVTTTSPLARFVVSYVTLIVGASLSIFVILIFLLTSFPTKSFTVTVSSTLLEYVLVNTFPFADFVHPLTSCTASFDVSVTCTSLFVKSVELYSIPNTGPVLSIFSILIVVLVSFPALSFTTTTSSTLSE